MKEHFLLSLMLLTMSCASARPMTASPAPAADIALMSAAPTSQQLHDEITASADDLGAAATSMGLSVTTTTTATPLSAETMTKPAETTCAMPPPVKETCHSTCELATRICSDAGNICKLAAQLPGDAWASERCDAGERSCEAARARCCDCH